MALNNFGLGFELTAKDSASAAVVALGKNLGALQRNAEDVNQTFDKTAGRTRDLATGRFVKAPPAMLDSNTWGKVGAIMSVVAGTLTAAGASMSYGLNLAVEEAEKFGKALAEVSTLVPETQFKMADMRKEVFALSSQFGGDMADQMKAMYQGISAGAADAASSTALMTQANKLAIAGVTDVKTAVDGLTNVLNAYGSAYTEQNLAGLSDAFFVAIKGGKTTAAELAGTLGRLAPTASAVGVSMEQMLASVAAVTTKGLKTEEAVSGLKAAIANIISPTSDAAAEAARLGVKFDAATLRAKGLPKFLDDITSSSKFNADSMSKLFSSVEGLNSVLALTANNGKAFNDLLENMKNKSGETAKAFEKMANTSAFQSQLFQGLKQQTMILIGEAIEPMKVGMLKIANAIMRAFTSAPAGLRKFVVTLIVAASAFATFLGGAVGAAVAIGGLIVMGKALLIALAAVAGIMGIMAAAAFPLILIASAIYVAWTKNIGGFQQTVMVWFDRIKLTFQALQQVFSDGGFSGAVLGELNKAENAGIKQFAINVFMWVGRIKNFVRGVGAAFELGMERVGPIIEKIISAFQRLVGRFSPVKEGANEAMTTFQKFGAAGGKVGDFLVAIVEKVATVWLGIINFIDGAVEVFEGFKPALVAAWDAAKGLFSAIGSLFSAFSGGKSSAQDTADTWRTIGNVFGFVANLVFTSLMIAFRILGGIISVVAGIIGGVGELFSGVVQGISTGIQLVVALFSGNWAQAWDLAKQLVIDWGTTILNMFLKIIGGAAGLVDSLGKIFGKDLGLKAKVEGMGAGMQPGAAGASAASPAALPAASTAPGAAPGVAAAQLAPMAVTAPVVQPAPKLPDVNLKTTLTLDGRTAAEAMQKANLENAGRGFGVTGTPTG